jgi:hypothetical protein
MELPIQAYLPKPFDPEILVTILEEALRQEVVSGVAEPSVTRSSATAVMAQILRPRYTEAARPVQLLPWT